MKNEIPIILSNNAIIQRSCTLRSPTVYRVIRTHEASRNNQSPSSIITRARRISSTTAAKKFPKDFFGPEYNNSFRRRILKTQSQQETDFLRKKNYDDCLECQYTPEFKKDKDSNQLKIQQLTYKQSVSFKRDQHPEQYLSVKEMPEIQIFKISKLQKQHRGQGLSEMPLQKNKFQVTLSQKISQVMLYRRQKERKRMTKLNIIDPQKLLVGLQGTPIKKQIGFRIRKGLL